MKITHLDMEYHIFQTDDGYYDVEDAGGCRPLGLRAKGPWPTVTAAVDDICSMGEEEAQA